MEGVKQIRESDLDPLFVFVMPPSIDELKRRLVGRNTETPESIQKRLDTAIREIEYGILKLRFKNSIRENRMRTHFHLLLFFYKIQVKHMVISIQPYSIIIWKKRMLIYVISSSGNWNNSKRKEFSLV